MNLDEDLEAGSIDVEQFIDTFGYDPYDDEGEPPCDCWCETCGCHGDCYDDYEDDDAEDDIDDDPDVYDNYYFCDCETCG